jgi:hypothetical protein
MDSKESIPPAYVTYQTGTSNKVVQITLEKEITNSRGHLCILIWKCEFPVLLYFHNSVWKYIVPFAVS